MFDNGSEFKRDFTHLLKYFYIKLVSTTVKNPQSNTPVELVHQVILNMLVTKYPDNKVFKHIYPWDENLSYIAWVIRASCHHTIIATQVQDVFVKDMTLNLTSVVYWTVVTAVKQ